MNELPSPPEHRSTVNVWPAVANFVALLVLVAAMTGMTLVLVNHDGARGRGGSGEPFGAPTPTVDVTVSEFSVVVAQFASAPAGNVTFVVKNAGSIEHELIVLKIDKPFNRLPIVDGGDPPAPVKSKADKIDESASVGETGDPAVKPGETRTFTVKHMTAGSYALVCNIASHYGLGMRAVFTVH